MYFKIIQMKDKRTCASSLKYRISGNFGAMEILALLAEDKNTPN